MLDFFSLLGCTGISNRQALGGTVNHAVRSPYIPRMPPREVRTESQLPPASWPEAQGAGSYDPTQCGISAGWDGGDGGAPGLH